jgi:DNA repair protein SbcD/Mre11
VRFLHTSDWHVGKTLRGRSRQEEFAAALDEVAGLAAEARVDAVLVAGDAERLVFDFLARLHAEGIASVVIAGNHDHPKRLGALARLLESMRIHVRSEVRRPKDGGVVGLQSRDGKEEACIAALPFVPERRLFDACQVMGPEEKWYEAYTTGIEKMLDALTRGLSPSTVNLLMAHVFIQGARVGTGVRPLHLGEVYGLDAAQLPSNVSYIALGHLHRPQQLRAAAPTCYSGSLLELDFGEQDQDKRVVIVEARPGEQPHVESAPLSSGRKLRELTGTLQEIRAAAKTVGDAWLRVTVRVVVPTPGIAEHVKELLPDALEVAVEFPREKLASEGRSKGLRQQSPEQLFAEYCAERNGAPPAPKLLELFRRLHDEAARA